MNPILMLIPILRDTYTLAGINTWLMTPNRNLDGERPFDLLIDGETDRVLAEARRVGGEG
jgi:Protein of unknown function (DUF2384)